MASALPSLSPMITSLNGKSSQFPTTVFIHPNDPASKPVDSCRTKLAVVRSSIPVKRLMATKELIASFHSSTGMWEKCSEEVRNYYAMLPAIYRTWKKLLDLELISYAELASCAGNGELLTKLLRSIIQDAPEIITPYDDRYQIRRSLFIAHWAKYEHIGDKLPGNQFSTLALQRNRVVDERCNLYVKMNPLGDDGKSYIEREMKSWKDVELKLLGGNI